MNELLGMKELYSMTLKATYPMKIGNREIEEGEVVASFDKIMIANFEELKTYTAARGGFDNRDRVIWESTKEVDITFSQGVFSPVHLALLGNAKLLEESESDGVLVPKTEMKESDEEGIIQLSEQPAEGEKLFVYAGGEKVKDVEIIGETSIKIPTPYTDTVIHYSFLYDKGVKIIKVGRRLVEGFLRLEAKTRLKDDTTGQNRTGIITIPKLKLVSDLSMRLGKSTNPVVTSFHAVGHPVGSKGNKTVMDFVLLESDIDIED